MPRLTEARKELRRAQITEAAVRCFGRHGLERTSITDITAESGLSTGSIYAHYRNKAELIQASARATLEKRADVIGQYAAEPTPPSPDELLARLTSAINPGEAKFGVQIWGEATTDPAIGAIVTAMVDRLRGMIRDCVAAWLIKAEGRGSDEAAVQAVPIARDLMARYLAELLHLALTPSIEETTG